MIDPVETHGEPTVIEVRAPWCHSCRAMQPLIDAAADEFAGSVRLVVIDASHQPEVVRDLRVLGTPTLIGVNGGAEIGRITGTRNAAEVRELFRAAADGRHGAVAGPGSADTRLRVLAGAALAVLGLLTGPAWVLTGAGAGVAAWGLVGASARRRSRGRTGS